MKAETEIPMTELQLGQHRPSTKTTVAMDVPYHVDINITSFD